MVVAAVEGEAAFGTRYRDGNWGSVQVSLRNGGPDFSGTLSLSASASQFLGQSNPTTPSNYQAPISLANGAQKQVTMYIPLYFYESGVAGKLLAGSGNAIGPPAAPLHPLMPLDGFFRILSGQRCMF